MGVTSDPADPKDSMGLSESPSWLRKTVEREARDHGVEQSIWEAELLGVHACQVRRHALRLQVCACTLQHRSREPRR